MAMLIEMHELVTDYLMQDNMAAGGFGTKKAVADSLAQSVDALSQQTERYNLMGLDGGMTPEGAALRNQQQHDALTLLTCKQTLLGFMGMKTEDVPSHATEIQPASIFAALAETYRQENHAERRNATQEATFGKIKSLAMMLDCNISAEVTAAKGVFIASESLGVEALSTSMDMRQS